MRNDTPGPERGEAISLESASQQSPQHVHSDAGFERIRQSVVRGIAQLPSPDSPPPDAASTGPPEHVPPGGRRVEEPVDGEPPDAAGVPDAPGHPPRALDDGPAIRLEHRLA